MTELAWAAAFYAFALAGSVSVGYLAIRTAFPEFRSLLPEEKLGYSALLGGFIVVVSAAVDAATAGMGKFFSASGGFPAIAFVVSAGVFVCLFAYSKTSKRDFVSVAVPKRIK